MKSLVASSILISLGLVWLPAEDVIDPLAKGDLSDWIASEHWSIKDGVVTGKTTDADPLPFNRFLIWNGGELKDFELTCQLKLVGTNNSGIQYRSRLLPDIGEDVVGGYQCDVHPNANFTAMMYEEKGRGIVATRGQKIVITAEGKKMLVGEVGNPDEVIDVAQWTIYTVRAEGNRMIHKANGIVIADVIDLQEDKRALSGKLAFQIHRGPAMEVHIKDIRIQPLPEGKVLTEEDVTIPEGAKEVHAPKRRQ